MKDAFGGAFMIRLFLIFIFIYMFFTAIALNYAKAFKVKNRVIDYLEDYEIISISNMNAAQYEQMEEFFEINILGELNYRIPREQMKCNSSPNEVYCDNGIKIVQIDASDTKSDNLGVYYKVTTEFSWNLGFLQKLTALGSSKKDGSVSAGIWEISGETRMIISE